MPSGRIEWIEKYPIDEFDPPHQRPWNRSLRWYYTEYGAEKWLALLLPWVGYLVFLIFLYSQLIAYLRRSALKQDLKSLSWRFNDVRPRFGSRKLIGELQPLRKLACAFLCF
jgi:hypothetical protein